MFWDKNLRSWVYNKITGYRFKKREKFVLNKCGCVCYCPNCKDILNDQATCEDVELVTYKCNVCEFVSVWTFDAAPVPICLNGQGGEIISKLTRLPETDVKNLKVGIWGGKARI